MIGDSVDRLKYKMRWFSNKDSQKTEEPTQRFISQSKQELTSDPKKS